MFSFSNAQNLDGFLPKKETSRSEKLVLKKINKSKSKVFYKKLGKKVPPKVEIIFDGSGSMGQILSSNRSKMYHSKELLKKYLQKQWKEKALVGLRVYGSKRKGDCNDSELAINFQEKSLYDIESKIKKIGPLGMTPLQRSIMLGVKDLEGYDGPKRIIILTDGEDTCGGDPCKTAEYLRSKPDIDLKFYSVGVGFDGGEYNLNNLKCLGPVLNADNEKDLQEGLKRIDQDIFSDYKNLKVISPNQNDNIRVYKINKNGKKGVLVRTFVASEKIKLEPGLYQAIVDLKPNFVFQKFKIQNRKLTILHVKGEGTFRAEYHDDLVNVEVYDVNGKVVKTGKAGDLLSLEMGKYEIRLFHNPFYEYRVPLFDVYPNSKHKFKIVDASSYVFKNKQLRGFHVYKGVDDLFGKYLTNAKGVLPVGRYVFHLDDSCSVKKIEIKNEEKFKTVRCP